MALSRFAFPTAIHFGAGASAAVGPHLLEQGRRRPLVGPESFIYLLCDWKST